MMQGFNTVEKQTPKPAKSRFSDPIALRAVYDRLTEEDLPEAKRRVTLRNMYEGNLPYNPEQLRNCGLKNIANVNFLGLKGVIDNRADALLKLSADTTNLIELRPLARELAGPDAERISRVVAEEFSNIIRETGKVIPALSMMHTEADLYGLGPVTWPNSLDYNPVALERGQLRFIGNGSVISSNHDLFMFESTLPASYIFYLLDNKEIATSEGWDVKVLERWLVDVFANGQETAAQPSAEDGTSVMEHSLSLYRQNRYQEEHQFDELKVIHAFVREMSFPRAITHIMMPATELKEFLFVKTNAYRTMDECLLWFPYSVNSKYARAVRGLASFLFPIEALNNRFTCQMVDVAFRASTFVLTQKSAGAQPNLTINEQGPYTFIPQEFVPAQSQVSPNFQQLAQVKQLLDNIGVNTVTGGDKGILATTGPKLHQGTDRPTKAEVEIQQRQRSHKEEALFVQKLSVFDKVFRETFKRFIRLATSGNPVLTADYPEIDIFLERCARRGVTPDILAEVPNAFSVVTCRDLVLGSEGKVGVLSEVIGAFGGSLDEAGRRNAVRDIVHLRMGQAAADRYVPESNRDQQPSDAASLATLENNMFREGKETMVGQDQLHWSHIPIHSRLLQEIVEIVGARPDNEPSEEEAQQIENPKGLLQMLVACSQHIQEHLAIGGQQIGMQQQTKQVQKMLRDLRPTVKSLNLAVATQERVEQAEREKQQREMEDLQRRADENELRKETYKADKQAEVDRYRIDRQHEVDMHKLQLDTERQGRLAEIADRKAAGDEDRRQRETDARIQAANKMAQAKANAANAVHRMNSLQQATGFNSVSPADIAGETMGTGYESL